MVGKMIAIAAMAGLATAATAQNAGLTYPNGSNLPQRTAGVIAPQTSGQASGSVGSTGAKPSRQKQAGKKAGSGSRTTRSSSHGRSANGSQAPQSQPR